MAAQLKRPRCFICDGPMPYGKPGFNLSATTCSKACHIKRNNWFIRWQPKTAATPTGAAA